MSRKKGQTFSSDQKAKIVLELLKEEQTIGQLATQYQVTSKTISNWKKQFLENANRAFEDDKVSNKYKEQIEIKNKEIDALAKTLGKTTVKMEWAVGKLKSLDLINKKELVESKHKKVSIADQCELLNMSRSSYYYKAKQIDKDDIEIMNKIDEIHTDSSEYGYRQIYHQLKDIGVKVGRDRVLKYMGIMGIQAIYPHKKKQTSIKDNEHKTYAYLLKEYWSKTGERTKSVEVKETNEVWSGDITYIRTANGFVYLAAVIDWHSRAILSYKISNTIDTTLACDVLKDALYKYPNPKIFNSDQGSQYTSKEHTDILKEQNIQISMNGRGRSIDNIMIERFFRTLKYSNIYISDYQSIKELKEGVKEYMNKYNFKRFHSSIGYKQPMNYYLETVKNVA
jgi:putative transposase